jgi:chromosome partitioning protein
MEDNATMGSGVDKYEVERTAYELLIDDAPINEVIIHETSGGYHLIAANADVTAAEIRLMEFFAREIRLRNALASVRDKYDYVFIDCPPSERLPGPGQGGGKAAVYPSAVPQLPAVCQGDQSAGNL